jgi:hypothetical protein
MTAPEDRRDEDQFERTLVEEEREAGAYDPGDLPQDDSPGADDPASPGSRRVSRGVLPSPWSSVRQ